jgi:hypothetical protein
MARAAGDKMKFNFMRADTLTTIVEGFGVGYIIIAGAILLFFGLPWLLLKRGVQNHALRRLFSSLVFALAFAPSIYGFDLGAVTVPAVFVILLTMRGGLTFIALIWSAFSLVLLWGIIFGTWSLFSFIHKRLKG